MELGLNNLVESLIRDLLDWVATRERTYAETMDAWRTSCPRLTVWEDAIDAGLIVRVQTAGRATRIELTERGAAFLSAFRP